MKDPNKLTRKELEEEYIARIKSESRQPETEEQRQRAKERMAKIDAMVKENLQKKGITIE
ncbi:MULTISPECIES: histidine kinase [Aerococcus]|uniref:histidine kinase n=1 Tax=Aerococcus TaxID=1375 RepID=UPI000DCF4922|nr:MULTISPECIES: histidine kinase [Aerococcus]KAA9298023.1 histidine kinase [Aerococcus tenax]MDK6689639.1 histidine kinase [Aerococcus urinae]MDK8133343.1 histidine kinase [Aerococcus urinae]MDK8484858.1 histidine kinase [Aerococcus urinae]MDL5177713.1 histidine kinase [Aerococcus tenax]